MVAHKESRSLHNVVRGQVVPAPTLNINHPKRLVRKHRKAKPSSTLFTENRLHSLHDNGSELKIKDNFKKPTTNDRKSPIMEEKNRNDRASGGVTAVPNPLPDTGVRPTNVQGAVYHTTTTSGSAHVTQVATSSASTFSPLPPLVTLATNSISVTSLPSSSTFATSISSSATNAPAHQASQAHQLPTAMITLLAVGAACLLLGIFIIIKVCSRPRRRTHPTPSLPILDDPFPDHEKFTEPESPIFGGKERFSSRPGSNGGLWAWTQYPQPGPTKPVQAVLHAKVAGGDSVYSGVSGSQGVHEKDKNQYVFDGHPHAHGVPTQTPATSPYQAPLQQVQSALTRAASRLSTMSTMYPGSPFNIHVARNVGIAIGGPGTALTADGHPVIKRTKSKTALQRSRSNTANELGNRDPESIYTRYSQGFAYDGADVTSPTVEAHSQSQFQMIPNVPIVPNTPSSRGRSRIKSAYYASGSYPRISNFPISLSTPARANVDISNLFESQHIPPIQKSDSRRNRDTQALASVLRLVAPTQDHAPPSPQPTLYPEDSLSVRAPRKRDHKKKIVPNRGHTDGCGPIETLPEMTPTMETSAALGSLMLMDFGATNKSLAALGGRLGECLTQTQQAGSPPSTTPLSGPIMENQSKQLPSGGSKKNSHARSDDKPPRVPSPPPLPSLTQMGLEHTNPEAYADYRSPTYSIYGLYENDRKSRTGSIGYLK